MLNICMLPREKEKKLALSVECIAYLAIESEGRERQSGGRASSLG
jgi:hypothetical protein